MAKTNKYFVDDETGMRNDERTRDLWLTAFGDSLAELIENAIIIERGRNDYESTGASIDEYSNAVYIRCLDMIEEEIIKTNRTGLEDAWVSVAIELMNADINDPIGRIQICALIGILGGLVKNISKKSEAA